MSNVAGREPSVGNMKGRKVGHQGELLPHGHSSQSISVVSAFKANEGGAFSLVVPYWYAILRATSTAVDRYQKKISGIRAGKELMS